MALLVGIFVASCGSGGITASLINIPGTPAAAATRLDGNALTKPGRGREAVGDVYKRQTLTNMTNNVFLSNCDSVNSVAITSGIYDPVARKLYV